MKKTIAAYIFCLSVFAVSFYLFLVGIANVQAEREEHARIHPAQGVRVVTK